MNICSIHWQSDSTFMCCKTVEDPHCPVTVLLAIRCFALFTFFQILHKIWKFCMKFGHLILRKIIEFVATSQILRLKCTKFNFGWGSATRHRHRWGSLQHCIRWNHLLLCGSQEPQRGSRNLWLQWGCALGRT